MTEISEDLHLPTAVTPPAEVEDEQDHTLAVGEGVSGTQASVDDLAPEDKGDKEFGELADPDRDLADARRNVSAAFDGAQADEERHDAEPDDVGDGAGDGHSDTPESSDDDDEVRRAYGRFSANIAALKTSIAEIEDPTAHPDYVGRAGTTEQPGALIFRVGDIEDESGEKNYETRIVPDADEVLRAHERTRLEALMRARQIEDPQVRADLEHIEAYGTDDEQIVTRTVLGDKVNDLLPADKAKITGGNIRGNLNTVETMVQYGLVPNPDYGDSVVVHPETGRLQFKDYVPIEEAGVEADRPILVTADSFMGVAERLYEPGVRDRETREASDRFQEASQHALKEHLLYKRPYVAYPPEELEEDAIRALYAHTAPTRRSTTHDLHIASSMHELALQGQGNDLQQSLDALGDAREAYEMVVFQQIIDRHGDLHQVIREDEQGRNPLLINDHFLQARLALACWPASEARVRGEDLTLDQRLEINQNLAGVIQQMMPGDEAPVASHQRESSYSGFLTEAVAMTALSRVWTEVDTSLALPTSEVQRLYGGPDAMVIFDDDDGEAALDEDWKLGGSGGPDTVNVGSICYGVATKLEERPFADDDTRAQKVWKSVVHVAKLLRDEGIERRRLTASESAVLDQVQGEIWGTIAGKAAEQLGIDDLRGRARF